MSCKIILLILPICDLKGLINLQVGLFWISFLWSLSVIKHLVIVEVQFAIKEIITLHAQGMPQVYHMNQSKWHLHQNGLFNKLLWICSMLDRSLISLVQTGSLDGSFCIVSSRDKQLLPSWYLSAEKYSKHMAHLRRLAQTVGHPSQLTHSNSSLNTGMLNKESHQ